MHDVPPEIVESIVGGLDPDIDIRALAALARTSTIFHESALDALWKHQDTFLNLIRCMPADVWETTIVARTPTLTPTREILPSDWDRVMKYAPRVKSLLCCAPENPSMTAVYQMLRESAPSSESLLPNLKRLKWRNYDSPDFSFIDLFLGPQVTSVILGTPFDKQCPILATLGQTNPGLLSVVIQGVNVGSPGSEKSQLWNFIRALPLVEVLDVRVVDSEILQYLGGLPSLKGLSTCISDPSPLQGIASRSLFSNLRNLSLQPKQEDRRGVEIASLIALLRACDSPPLTSFVAFSIVQWTLKQVEELYEVLSGHCLNEHLLILQFEFIMKTKPPLLTPHPGHFFRPLFSFARLTVLEIDVPAGYDLEDKTVEDMARAWPNLEELSLKSRSDHQPRCTLKSLHSFARHCPRLCALHLTFDASGVPPSLIMPTDPLPQGKLMSLNVAYSRTSYNSLPAVAVFMASLFSNIKKIVTDDGFLWDMNDSVGRLRHAHWEDIAWLLWGGVRHR
ncbi:hypothetical protein B0H12DRAFT_1321429 [Mycena haematopus]|nr:hypothetical protein B0H12DRAFT_1321429 [Mycena haematopus]